MIKQLKDEVQIKINKVSEQITQLNTLIAQTPNAKQKGNYCFDKEARKAALAELNWVMFKISEKLED